MRGSLSFCAVLVLALGCSEAGSPPRGPANVQGYAVAPVPIDSLAITRAPRVSFAGEWARLVDGHWYYPTRHGWVVFVQEPEELRRERETIATDQPPTAAPMPRGPEAAQVPALFEGPAH